MDEARSARDLTLEHVLWIGGSTCAGKTGLSRRIAGRRNHALFPVDAREPKRLEDVDVRRYPAFGRWARMSLDDRWVASSVDELVIDTLALCGDLFPMIVEALEAESKPTVVEGFQPLPDLVAEVIPTPQHAVFLVATPEFRRATHYLRPHAWSTPRQTSDPDRAQQNRLERDDRIGEHIARTAIEHGFKVIAVDGTRSIDEIAADAEAHLVV